MGPRLPDTNTTQPIDLDLGIGTDRTQVANPIAPTGPQTKPVIAPGGLVLVDRLAPSYYLSKSPTDGGIAIYSCSTGGGTVNPPGGGNRGQASGPKPAPIYVGPSSICSGYRASLVGYTWPARAEVKPLWQCTGGFDGAKYLSLNSSCVAGGSGYQIGGSGFDGSSSTRQSPISANSVLTATKSFTTAAWVKTDTAGRTTVPMSTDDAGAGFTLEATDTEWRFCTKGTSPVTCVTTPRQNSEGWTHVAAEFDAANTELRLYINGVLASSTGFAWPAGTSTTPVALNVGGRSVNGIWAWSLSGQIADPSVFAGILTAGEITSLRAGQDPLLG